MLELRLLLLLLVANGSPLAAKMLFGSRFAWPLDGGRHLRDGHRLLGPSKTVRGALTAIVTSGLAGALLGVGWLIGALIGTFAMLGDALSSFIKRRRGLASGSKAPGLDHLPESLLPLLVCQPLLDLSLVQIALLGLAFMVADLLLSRLLFRLGVQEHPH